MAYAVQASAESQHATGNILFETDEQLSKIAKRLSFKPHDLKRFATLLLKDAGCKQTGEEFLGSLDANEFSTVPSKTEALLKYWIQSAPRPYYRRYGGQLINVIEQMERNEIIRDFYGYLKGSSLAASEGPAHTVPHVTAASSPDVIGQRPEAVYSGPQDVTDNQLSSRQASHIGSTQDHQMTSSHLAPNGSGSTAELISAGSQMVHHDSISGTLSNKRTAPGEPLAHSSVRPGVPEDPYTSVPMHVGTRSLLHGHPEDDGTFSAAVMPRRTRMQPRMPYHIPMGAKGITIGEMSSTLGNSVQDQFPSSESSPRTHKRLSANSELSLEGQLTKAKQLISELQNENEGLQHENKELHHKEDEQLRRIFIMREHYKKQNEDDRKQHLAEIDNLQRKNENLEKELVKAELREAEQVDSVKEQRRLLRKQEMAVDERERHLAEREEIVEARDLNHSAQELELSNELAECYQKIKQLEMENDNLHKTNEELHRKIEELSAQLAQLVGVEERLEKRMDKRLVQVKAQVQAQVQAQLEEMQEKIAAVSVSQPTTHSHNKAAMPFQRDSTSPAELNHGSEGHGQPPAELQQGSSMSACGATASKQPLTVTVSGYASKIDIMAVSRIIKVWPGYTQHFDSELPGLAEVINVLHMYKDTGSEDYHEGQQCHADASATSAETSAADSGISAAVIEIRTILGMAPDLAAAIQWLKTHGNDITLSLEDADVGLKEAIVRLNSQKDTVRIAQALQSCLYFEKLCKQD